MSETILKPLIYCHIILCFIRSENAFSIKQWNRENVTVTFDKPTNTISIKFLFIDYKFGPFGEHAYLEEMEFEWEQWVFEWEQWVKDYETLMKCQVQDQILSDKSAVYMTKKSRSAGSELRFVGCFSPANKSLWADDTNELVHVVNISKKGYLTIEWKLPSYVNIASILVRGKWHVNGLNCAQLIIREVIRFRTRIH